MIRSLAFENTVTGWKLEETSFGELNLLVGPSGAGKTRILDALRHIREMIAEGSHSSGSCNWSLTVGADGDVFKWEVEIEAGFYPGRFLRELIVRNDDETLVDRAERFLFKGRELPRLQESRSAIELLQSEDDIGPLYQAISRWLFLESSITEPRVDIRDLELEEYDGDGEAVPWTLDRLKRESELPILAKAYLLQQSCRQEFDALRHRYCDIFPTVVDLRIGKLQEFARGAAVRPDYIITVGVREAGVDRWIEGDDLSAGMLKVLYYLIELALTAPESVIFIDELENSLGVNCLPDLSEEILIRSTEVQFIITSHHPQVINSITEKHWKLVTRRGSVVTVRDAESIPALRTASPLQKFTQLINLPEYAEGVA